MKVSSALEPERSLNLAVIMFQPSAWGVTWYSTPLEPVRLSLPLSSLSMVKVLPPSETDMSLESSKRGRGL